MMFEPSHNVAKVARGLKVASPKVIVPQKVANQMANVVNALKVNLVVKATAVLKQVRRAMANVVVTETADQKMDRHVTVIADRMVPRRVMANVAQMVMDVVSRQRRYSSKCSIGTKMA